MSSSGGSYQGPIMTTAGPQIPNLPVAGADSTIGSPFEYGKFQNFLPDAKASGPNDMATGLRPEMFQYRSPSGVVAESGLSGQIQGLRDQLAQLQASSSSSSSSSSSNNQFGAAQSMSPAEYAQSQYQQLPPSTFYGSG